DPLTNLIRLKMSPIYELVISLRALLHPARRDSEWAQHARETLEPAFWTELSAVYEPYAKGGLFFELAVDYPDDEDVPGFLEYVLEMDHVRFVVYLVGRVVTVDRLAESRLDPSEKEVTLNAVRNQCIWVSRDIV